MRQLGLDPGLELEARSMMGDSRLPEHCSPRVVEADLIDSVEALGPNTRSLRLSNLAILNPNLRRWMGKLGWEGHSMEDHYMDIEQLEQCFLEALVDSLAEH